MITLDLIRSLSDDELIHSYGTVIDELKRRGIIRSKNVVGDLSEYTTAESKGLPKLQPAPPEVLSDEWQFSC